VWRIVLATVFCTLLVGRAHTQTVPDGRGGAASLWAGAEYANYQAGFPKDSTVRLAGIGAFATYNLNRHYAVEMHARFLNLNSWNGETEQDYLIGPRYSFLRGEKLRPFALFQVGMVKMQYPFQMGSGTSFAMAPAGGVEYRLNRKWSVRGAYEFQMLANSPNFTNEPQFGIHPVGATVGIAYRIFSGK
jgi:opacity protein-like surface antigen